jgi:hypothetical protein
MSASFSDVTIKSCFLLIEPAMAPRTEWACQPVASVISIMHAPFARRSNATMTPIFPLGFAAGGVLGFGGSPVTAGTSFLRFATARGVGSFTRFSSFKGDGNRRAVLAEARLSDRA